MNPRTNEPADALLVRVDGAWWFTRRDWPSVEGQVSLAGPYPDRERALETARHPEWAIRTRSYSRSVLVGAETATLEPK